jgi:hypothetical protein
MGAKTAERGPTQIRASPRRRRSHSSWRSPAPSRECSTATVSPKRATKRADDLRRQADLGHQDDDRAPAGQRVGGGAEVDLGLARARDAVEQERLAGRRGADRRDRRLLLGGQRGLRPRRADAHVDGRAPHDPRRDPHEPAGLQAPQRGGVGAAEARQARQQRTLRVAQARRAASSCRFTSLGEVKRRLDVRALRVERGLGLRARCGARSDSARAGVEQYSSASQNASSTSSRGSGGSSTRRGATSSCSESGARPVTIPGTSRRPNGTMSRCRPRRPREPRSRTARGGRGPS